MENANDLLKEYTCTDHYHKTMMPNFFATDGVVAASEEFKCYWFIDVILSYQFRKVIRSQSLQVWKIQRLHKNKFIATCFGADFRGEEICLIKQEIPFSDFPHDNLTYWLRDGVILLPSEY
jgi:hypothetical protein